MSPGLNDRYDRALKGWRPADTEPWCRPFRAQNVIGNLTQGSRPLGCTSAGPLGLWFFGDSNDTIACGWRLVPPTEQAAEKCKTEPAAVLLLVARDWQLYLICTVNNCEPDTT